MKKGVGLLIIILFILTGCQQNKLKQQLILLDSLANKGEYQKVIAALDNIVPESINDEECLAYYWLLRISSEIKSHKLVTSTKPLDITTAYYEKNIDKNKLARAYNYKAIVLEIQGKSREAITNFKKAEALIKDNKDETSLANAIYSNLAIINRNEREYELSKKYASQSLKLSYALGDEKGIATTLNTLATINIEQGNKDSARYYLNKSIPLLSVFPSEAHNAVYGNIGNLFLRLEDYANAEKYLLKAAPNPFVSKGLAIIYYKRGEKERARKLFEKALKLENPHHQLDVLEALCEVQQDEGDYKTACETAMKIVQLVESITKREKEEDIKGMQQLFEQEQAEALKQQRLVMWGGLSAVLLLMAIAAVVWLSVLHRKGKKELKHTQQQLEQYGMQLEALQQQGKTDSKEVERLTRKIAELQRKRGAMMENGRAHLEEIENGGTTVRWHRSDFTDCIEYYRTLDADFVVHMETGYGRLSDKYIFFALMKHLGKSDEELQRIMGISQSTIRSIRSRIINSKNV